MPKTKKEKPHHSKPYTRVTHKSIFRFDDFKSEDSTNLTTTHRDTKHYSYLLNIDSLPELILSIAKIKGKPIRILDAGCGKAVAIDELLTNQKLNGVIEQVTGASLNYFENIKSVMEKHGKRFYFYLGKVQDVLAKSHDTFDLILDAWGAFAYSEDKLSLLKQYHDALTPFGTAHVFAGKSRELTIVNDNEQVQFMSWVTKNFPENFTVKNSRNPRYFHEKVIKLKKISQRYLVPDFKVESSELIRSTVRHADLSHSKLKFGNALRVGNVTYEKSETQSVSLRPLPFGKK